MTSGDGIHLLPGNDVSTTSIWTLRLDDSLVSELLEANPDSLFVNLEGGKKGHIEIGDRKIPIQAHGAPQDIIWKCYECRKSHGSGDVGHEVGVLAGKIFVERSSSKVADAKRTENRRKIEERREVRVIDGPEDLKSKSSKSKSQRNKSHAVHLRNSINKSVREQSYSKVQKPATVTLTNSLEFPKESGILSRDLNPKNRELIHGPVVSTPSPLESVGAASPSPSRKALENSRTMKADISPLDGSLSRKREKGKPLDSRENLADGSKPKKQKNDRSSKFDRYEEDETKGRTSSKVCKSGDNAFRADIETNGKNGVSKSPFGLSRGPQGVSAKAIKPPHAGDDTEKVPKLSPNVAIPLDLQATASVVEEEPESQDQKNPEPKLISSKFPDSELNHRVGSATPEPASVRQKIVQVLALGNRGMEEVINTVGSCPETRKTLVNLIQRLSSADTKSSVLHLRDAYWNIVNVEFPGYTSHDKAQVVSTKEKIQNARRQEILSEADLVTALEHAPHQPVKFSTIGSMEQYFNYRKMFIEKYKLYRTLTIKLEDFVVSFEELGWKYETARDDKARRKWADQIRLEFECKSTLHSKMSKVQKVLHEELSSLKYEIKAYADH
uniref:OCEL domain-containing protein n=1 Tax=Compsopogon caeruleus TaxID=31354 RepID=A0A7S1TGP0_9RHOD|mmetsp:Transcript_3257/g.6123  ORF Transcript_3257/g.6123 Transcript_3257/m.6123 type:complete len:613 (+) Transcript_3257:813-2651(+)|eukprot:CAMPEP_0184682290 /NCGR_PEP_ID=MMETSP0312-20130426/6671_1 /TAXON_ID=31354 /ORGANISM="Compsopogon coeruleus, Strain SAG 36.94" /LENGTH=612 /DNA_ID=CAMNT_0027133861 /DNA_START=686 /DNA_END=2524 /DNA_ORIENTATION=-